MPTTRGSSQPRDCTHISYISWASHLHSPLNRGLEYLRRGEYSFTTKLDCVIWVWSHFYPPFLSLERLIFHRYSWFLFMFYKVTVNPEWENTEPLLLGETEGLVPASSDHILINWSAYNLVLCLRILYLIYIIDSLTLNSQVTPLQFMLNKAYLTCVFLVFTGLCKHPQVTAKVPWVLVLRLKIHFIK